MCSRNMWLSEVGTFLVFVGKMGYGRNSVLMNLLASVAVHSHLSLAIHKGFGTHIHDTFAAHVALHIYYHGVGNWGLGGDTTAVTALLAATKGNDKEKYGYRENIFAVFHDGELIFFE